ncbi:MAG: glycosyltransferase family 39 protein [Planctomycetota bacterium]
MTTTEDVLPAGSSNESTPPPSPESLRTDATHLRIAWGLIGFLTLWLGVGAFMQPLDSDSTKLITAAWHLASGERLYVDIWDNHGPLPMALLAVVFKAALGSFDSYGWLYVLRAVAFAMMIGGAWVTARLAREVLPEERWAPLFAAGLFLSSSIIGIKGIEIRSDTPLNLIWIASLWLWFCARRRDGALDWVLAGSMIGLGPALPSRMLRAV